MKIFWAVPNPFVPLRAERSSSTCAGCWGGQGQALPAQALGAVLPPPPRWEGMSGSVTGCAGRGLVLHFVGWCWVGVEIQPLMRQWECRENCESTTMGVKEFFCS